MKSGAIESPQDRATQLVDPVPFGGPSMHCHPLGEGETAALGSFPPLAESGHCDVVQGHLGVDPKNDPAALSEPDAQVGLFAGDQRGIVPADLPEGIATSQDVAAAVFGFANRRVPLEVSQAIVDRLLGVALAATSGDGGDIVALFEYPLAVIHPAFGDLAVTVDELDEPIGRIDLLQASKPFVAHGPP